MQPALRQLVNYVKAAKVFRRNKKNVEFKILALLYFFGFSLRKTSCFLSVTYVNPINCVGGNKLYLGLYASFFFNMWYMHTSIFLAVATIATLCPLLLLILK